MTLIEIFQKLCEMKIENLMRHEQMADVMDFMGLHGFKREAEYYYFKESGEFRSLKRFAINHIGQMVYIKLTSDIRLQPASWEGHTRQEVSDSNRRIYAKQLFNDWLLWEVNSKKKLHELYNEAVKLDLACSEKVLCFLEDVEKELKEINRQIIEYEAVGWDMKYIMQLQRDLHECYREKEKELGFDFN